MKRHDWRAVPYEEALDKGLHRDHAPYLWECLGCGTYLRTTSEAEPCVTLSYAIHDDCDVEVVSQVMEA